MEQAGAIAPTLTRLLVALYRVLGPERSSVPRVARVAIPAAQRTSLRLARNFYK